VKFKNVIAPVLKKIVQNDPERRGSTGARLSVVEGRATRASGGGFSRPVGRRVIDL
jgi:hypothetical protein